MFVQEAPELYQLFHIRNQLHRQGYQHKTSLCVERMYAIIMSF